MYQSGCALVDTWSGRYGPSTQIGLTVKVAAMTEMTPKTRKKKPPALAM